MYPEEMRAAKAFETAQSFYPAFDIAFANELSQRFGLKTKSKIGTLSTGYASIFRLSVALSANLPFMLLGEPVLGLDAQHRDMFYKILIEKYTHNPCTIIISTHLIQEAAPLIEQAIIIREGKVLCDKLVEELLSGVYNLSGPCGQVDAYTSDKTVLSQRTIGGLKTVCIEGVPENLPEGLEAGRVLLQDYFISLMNREETK